MVFCKLGVRLYRPFSKINFFLFFFLKIDVIDVIDVRVNEYGV